MQNAELIDLSGARLVRLMARVAEGDRNAFQQLYELTSARIFAVLRQMMGSEALAEEALQDAYLLIWTRASDFRLRRGSPMAWMTSIARYRGIDMLRKTKREILTDSPPEQAADADDEPSRQVSADSEAQALLDCLETLPAEQQRSVRMAFFAGATHQEVAASLATPLGTVKSWIRRGLQSLKTCLQEVVDA